MKECITALRAKAVIDGVEQDVLVMPITRLDCIEDTAETVDSAESGDYIPVIDSDDGGQMKKVKVEDLINGGALENIAAHITDTSAHPDIREAIGVVKDKIAAIEVASGVEVTANPFAVTFGSLDGITADGVWNATAARMEF